MKSINFTVPDLFDKILNGSKKLTIRGLFIPAFVENERILLKDVVLKNGKRVAKRSIITKVTYIRFIRLKEVTDALAEREGFNTAEESKEWLRKKYGKSDERWLVCICWRDLERESLREYNRTNEPNGRKQTMLDNYMGIAPVNMY